MRQQPFHRLFALSALALALTATAGCATQAKKVEPVAPAVQQEATAQADVSEQAPGNGLYEMALSGGKLWVAGAESFKDVNGGALWQLDPATLKTLGVSYTDLKNFGMVAAPDGKTLYVTNSLDGGVTAIDAANGKVIKRLMFKERNEKGFPFGAREIIWHDGQLWIGGVGDPAVIWIVDAKELTLKKRITQAGKWVTGLIWSPQTQRIYAANGGGEILTINPKTLRIEKRWTPDDGKEYLLLNFARDAATGRLFVTDNSKAKTTLVIDEHSWQIVKRLDTGDALGVKFNPVRNEIYISQRESGKVLSLDGTTYAVKKTWHLAPHPNSLLVSEDGQTLYVTVKQTLEKDHSTKGPDKVVRISLQ